MIDCNITENFFKEKRRMCKTYDRCSKCPMDEAREQENAHNMWCSEFCEENPKKVIEIVQQWSDEHPYRTMLSELIKLHPNIPLRSNGVPYICPRYVGWNDFPPSKCKASKRGDCVACWNRPFEEDQK